LRISRGFFDVDSEEPVVLAMFRDLDILLRIEIVRSEIAGFAIRVLIRGLSLFIRGIGEGFKKSAKTAL